MLTDFVCLLLNFPLEDCWEFGDFVIRQDGSYMLATGCKLAVICQLHE
jgi:hypothetical protein